MAKRGQGEGTISQRPDGTWWARISLGKDENGKQRRRAFYGKTRKEVQQKLTAALNEVNLGAYIEPSKLTVAQWMDIWLKEYKYNTVKSQTYADYCSLDKCNIRPKLGAVRLKDLRKDMVQRFVNEMSERGLSPSTTERVLRVLSGALKEAVESELISKNPATGITSPKGIRLERRVLTKDEQLRFIEAAKLDERGEIFILMLGTGMRIGETLALTWDDVSFDNAEIRVTKTLVENSCNTHGIRKRSVTFGTPKTKASYRTIPLLPQLVEMLRQLQSKQKSCMREMGGAFDDHNLVFCSRFGNVLYGVDMNKRLKRIAEKEGISGLHTHCLRHTFATRGLENGVPLKVMQEILGHADLSMTADLYTHVLPDTKQSEIAKLSGTIKMEV